MKSLLTLNELSGTEILSLIALAQDVKKNPSAYTHALSGKTLLMIFEKPSLRTRLSFDVGIKQLGGFGIVLIDYFIYELQVAKTDLLVIVCSCNASSHSYRIRNIEACLGD